MNRRAFIKSVAAMLAVPAAAVKLLERKDEWKVVVNGKHVYTLPPGRYDTVDLEKMIREDLSRAWARHVDDQFINFGTPTPGFKLSEEEFKALKESMK